MPTPEFSPTPIKSLVESMGKPVSDGGHGAPLGCTKPLMPMDAGVKLVPARVFTSFWCS